MNERYNDYWYQYASEIISENKEQWNKSRKLDKENTIDETKHLLSKVGFRNIECIYNYLKYGVVFAETKM